MPSQQPQVSCLICSLAPLLALRSNPTLHGKRHRGPPGWAAGWALRARTLLDAGPHRLGPVRTCCVRPRARTDARMTSADVK